VVLYLENEILFAGKLSANDRKKKKEKKKVLKRQGRGEAPCLFIYFSELKKRQRKKEHVSLLLFLLLHIVIRSFNRIDFIIITIITC
jgi:hypothetical protein